MAARPAIFRIGLSQDAPAERTLRLELSEDFDFNRPELLPEMTSALARGGQAIAQSAAGCLRDRSRYAHHLQRLPLALPPLCFRARIPTSSTVWSTWPMAPIPCCTPRFPPA